MGQVGREVRETDRSKFGHNWTIHREEQGGLEGGWDVSLPPKASGPSAFCGSAPRRHSHRTKSWLNPRQSCRKCMLILFHFTKYSINCSISGTPYLAMIITVLVLTWTKILAFNMMAQVVFPIPRNENAPSKNCRDWQWRRPRWYWTERDGKHQPQNLPGKSYLYRALMGSLKRLTHLNLILGSNGSPSRNR